ncbi:unnamed protein product [Closterium sp. NIES-53]
MAYISRCRELRDKLLRCGGSISEDAFVTVIIGGLGPQWRSTRAILRAHGKISEAALCAKIHAEQQDMDLQEERHNKKASVPEFAFHTQRRYNNNYQHQPKLVPPFCHLCKTSGHPRMSESEVLGFESQCVHFGHPSAGGYQRAKVSGSNPSVCTSGIPVRGGVREGLGYNLLSVSQLMAKGIHLEADSTTQEFKLYHGKDGLYIGKVVLKNNVFVLDFVPDLGTADSDGIVTFTSWTHPPDLDPDFSPEGFWYSHTIPEAERTRALATIQHSAAAETTSAAAETTPAAAKTLAAPTTLTTPVASSSTTSPHIDNTSPTPAQQLTPTPREVHRSANFTAAFYSNSDLYRRSPGHRASEDIWHARMGHPKTVAAPDVIFYERLTLPTYLANLEEIRDPTGGFHGDRHFASAADEADWDEQNVDNASKEAGPLPYCSVPIPMDDENPRESVNADTYFDLADTGYVTPPEVNTNEAERIGPNFIPDPETGDEAAYPEDTTLPRYTQSDIQILGLVTAVHSTDTPTEPATVQQALGGEHREKWREAMDKELKALQEHNTWKVVPIGVARNKNKNSLGSGSSM